MPLRVVQHYGDWVCTAVMSNDVSTAKIFHNVITHNRGTNPVTIISRPIEHFEDGGKSTGLIDSKVIYSFQNTWGAVVRKWGGG